MLDQVFVPNPNVNKPKRCGSKYGGIFRNFIRLKTHTEKLLRDLEILLALT